MLGLSLEAKAIALALLVAAVMLWFGAHDARIKRDAVAPVVAQVKAAEDAASAAATIKAARVDATQEGNLHEAIAMDAARVATARALADDVQRMRDDAVRPRPARQSPGASAPGDSASMPGADMVPGSLFRSALAARAEAESDAADLAAYAECLRTGGQLCATNYEALK